MVERWGLDPALSHHLFLSFYLNLCLFMCNPCPCFSHFRSDGELLGPNNQYLPKIVSVFAEVSSPGYLMTTINMLSSICSRSQWLCGIVMVMTCEIIFSWNIFILYHYSLSDLQHLVKMGNDNLYGHHIFPVRLCWNFSACRFSALGRILPQSKLLAEWLICWGSYNRHYLHQLWPLHGHPCSLSSSLLCSQFSHHSALLVADTNPTRIE